MGIEEDNMELMVMLDDAWNAQDLETFEKRHKLDVVVRWPGQPPTHGIEDQRVEAIEFFKTFPDQHLDNRPYKVFFASVLRPRDIHEADRIERLIQPRSDHSVSVMNCK